MKNYRDPLLAALGVLLVLAGLWQIRAGGSVLGYVCIGLGCGLFGHGTGELVARWSMRNDPALQKEQEILRRDERNVAIADHAKGRAFDLMTFVFGALMVSFALMEVDLAALLLLVFAYLFVEGYAVYCRCKYEKEMWAAGPKSAPSFCAGRREGHFALPPG